MIKFRKVNSESNHLFFGPLSTFPLPVIIIIIIIAQFIIDIKVKDMKIESICYSVECVVKIIVMTFQNYENVHFYYSFFKLLALTWFQKTAGQARTVCSSGANYLK